MYRVLHPPRSIDVHPNAAGLSGNRPLQPRLERLFFDYPTRFTHRHAADAGNKKDASTARVFFDEIPYRFAFAQSPDSFHLPPTISTITRARWSRPAWSFALMLKMPWEAGMSFVFSSAARSASRNAGVPG
jgi:hypothetical protein